MNSISRLASYITIAIVSYGLGGLTVMIGNPRMGAWMGIVAVLALMFTNED